VKPFGFGEPYEDGSPAPDVGFESLGAAGPHDCLSPAGNSQMTQNKKAARCRPNNPPFGWRPLFSKEQTMIETILVILLILFLLGGGYGYRSGNNILAGGGGLLGLVLLILLILVLLRVVSF
jgi:hypothetical protein